MSEQFKNLEKYRSERGLTEEELADELGISQSYYNKLEAGKKNPGKSLRSKLSAKLKDWRDTKKIKKAVAKKVKEVKKADKEVTKEAIVPKQKNVVIVSPVPRKNKVLMSKAHQMSGRAENTKRIKSNRATAHK